MTLDLYGHLFADDLDAVATRLDQARTASLMERGWNGASKAVLKLPVARASQVPVAQ
jgi:hypothetical protein